MKNIRNKQQGSAHVILIVVLVVALIGALGYIYWSNFIQSKDNDKDAAGTTHTTKSPSASPKVDKNTITLSDWGVKFTIPESLVNTSVKYSKDKDAYGFTTARIEALGNDCATQPYGKSILLSRSTSVPSGMDGYSQINKDPINGYYYVYTETIPSCSGSTTDPSVKVNQIEIDDKASLGNLLKSLKSL